MSLLFSYLGVFRAMMSPEIYEIRISKILFNAITILCAVVIFALFIATAALSKKQRVIGVIAAIVNVASVATIPLFVRKWHELGALISELFFAMENSASVETAYALLMESIKILVIVLIATAIMMVALALTIIYIAKSFKNKPAIFSGVALALIIFRQFFVAPFQTMFPMLAKLFMPSLETSVFMYSQALQLVIYFGIMIIALALVLIPVVIKKIKGEPAQVVAEAPKKEEPKADENA